LRLIRGPEVEDEAMQIELPHSGGRPNWQLTGARLRDALKAFGDVATPVTCRTAGDRDVAGRAGFRRLPTMLVSGRVRFGRSDDPAGLTCCHCSRASGDHSLPIRPIQGVLADAA
jgi:hypothetical protein